MARRANRRLDETESGAPEGLSRIVLRGVGVSSLGYFVTQAATLGFYLVLARLATPEDFGEAAAGALLVSIGLLFSESGMLAALVHRKDRLEEAAATAVFATLAAGVVFALVALALSPLIGTFFHSSKIGEIAAVASGLLLLRSIPIVPTALLQRKFSFVRRVVVEPVGIAAFGIVAIIATSNGMGAWGIILGYYAQAVADVILSWGLARWRPRLRLASVGMWRELVAYGRHILAASAIIRGANELPVLIIGRGLGSASLGQFRYSSRIATTPLAVVLAVASYVLFPAFARISDDRERLRAAFLRSLRWIAATGIPTGLIFIPLGVPIAVLIFGDTWREAGEAAAALAVFPACATIGSLISEVFAADGTPQLLTRMHLVEAIVGGVAMLALLPLGLAGVCAGVSLGAAAGAAYALNKVHSTLSLPARSLTAEIIPPLIASLAMVAVVTPLERGVLHAADQGTVTGLILLAVESAVALLVYAGVTRVLAPGRLGELISLVRRGAGAPDTPIDAGAALAEEERIDAVTDPLP